MLMRTDPFRELDRLSSRWFGDGERIMGFDAYRHGDVVVAEFDLPGFDPSSIDLTVERNEVRVEAERPGPSGTDRQYLVQERPTGKFSRRLYLGDNLDTDHVAASYDHGVLTVRIPLRESAKPRRVDVRSGEQAAAIEATSS
jgi:HSP20 family protein